LASQFSPPSAFNHPSAIWLRMAFAVQMKRILILMSDTGGGHRATAEALQSVFVERYGGRLRVDMEDLWLRHTPPPLNQVPKSYRLLVNDFPWPYRLIYRVGEEPLATPFPNQALRTLLKINYRRPVARHRGHYGMVPQLRKWLPDALAASTGSTSTIPFSVPTCRCTLAGPTPPKVTNCTIPKPTATQRPLDHRFRGQSRQHAVYLRWSCARSFGS
jgi:1,2-diacylglycerol 3-beta-galactosyltransferase